MRKSIFLFAFLCFAFTITSCSNDDNETTPPTVVDPFAGNSSVEDAVITISNDDIDVAAIGATILSTLPEPNGETIEMTVPSEESLAFPEEGFNIKLTPKADFEGIYVQLNGANGATDYLDIPKSSLVSEYDQNFSPRNEDPSYEINIDFGSNIKPGTFCYKICIYDAEGNISAPIEVCVTVKFFGGNIDLIGEWNLNTMKQIAEDVTSQEYAAGAYVCELDYETECEGSGLNIELNYCDAVPEIKLAINQDGTYTATITQEKSTYEVVDSATCSVLTKENEPAQTSIEEGNWSFDLDGINQKRLILIIRKETLILAGSEPDVKTYESGESSLEENVLNVSGNNFDITLFDEEDGVLNTYYFSK